MHHVNITQNITPIQTVLCVQLLAVYEANLAVVLELHQGGNWDPELEFLIKNASELWAAGAATAEGVPAAVAAARGGSKVSTKEKSALNQALQ